MGGLGWTHVIMNRLSSDECMTMRMQLRALVARHDPLDLLDDAGRPEDVYDWEVDTILDALPDFCARDVGGLVRAVFVQSQGSLRDSEARVQALAGAIQRWAPLTPIQLQ